MSDDHFIDFREFEPHRLTLAGVITKTPKPTKDPATGKDKVNPPYQQADFNYLYKLPDGKEIKDSFCIQFCTMKCYGIQAPSPGFNEYQLKGSFDKNNAEVDACLKVLDVIHHRMVDLICDPATYAALKIKNVDPTGVLAKTKGMGFEKLVHFTKDKATNEIDYDRNPTQYFKLNKYESSKTKFLALDENKKIIDIDWDIMSKAEFSGKPLIKYATMYSNSNTVKPQSRVVSMVLEVLKPKGADSVQATTLNKLAESNPEIATNINAGLASIIDRLASAGPKGDTNTKAENKQSEPLSSTPTDLKEIMRSGPSQVYSGPINPNVNFIPNQTIQQSLPSSQGAPTSQSNPQYPQQNPQQVPQQYPQQYQQQQYGQQAPQVPQVPQVPQQYPQQYQQQVLPPQYSQQVPQQSGPPQGSQQEPSLQVPTNFHLPPGFNFGTSGIPTK